MLLTQRSIDNSSASFDSVLSHATTNMVMLMGKAWALYIQWKYMPALKLFQEVLKLSPKCEPDPHVDIGLCLWALGNQESWGVGKMRLIFGSQNNRE